MYTIIEKKVSLEQNYPNGNKKGHFRSIYKEFNKCLIPEY